MTATQSWWGLDHASRTVCLSDTDLGTAQASDTEFHHEVNQNRAKIITCSGLAWSRRQPDAIPLPIPELHLKRCHSLESLRGLERDTHVSSAKSLCQVVCRKR